MTSIKAQPGIMDIELYQSGAARIEGVDNVIKLSSNENPLGPSPKAIEAYQRAATNLHRYPSSDQIGLRSAIGEVLSLDVDRIICGAGSDEIIAFLCQAFVGQGDEVIHTEHGFAMYRISALSAGATPVEVRESERVTDVDAILEACTPKTKLVFIANPNNPTGTMIGEAEIARLADTLPPQAILVLDGAYAEFVEGYDGGAALVDQRENVFMTRTFSKLYGLGSLRVGWGYGPSALVGVLNRIRGPFNVSQSALDAAEAAILDLDYTNYCRHENEKWRTWLANGLSEIGVPSDVSHANFILAHFDSQTEAENCDNYLQTQGLVVRRVAGYKLPNALRISIGEESACRLVLGAIKKFKAGKK